MKKFGGLKIAGPVDPENPFDLEGAAQEPTPSSERQRYMKPGEELVTADWRDTEGLIKSFRQALAKLGISMRVHPQTKGTDTYGFILGRAGKRGAVKKGFDDPGFNADEVSDQIQREMEEEGRQDKELHEEISSRIKPGEKVKFNGKEWEVEEGPNDSVRLIRWKQDVANSANFPGERPQYFRWIEDMCEMPKSYFDRTVKKAKKAGENWQDYSATCEKCGAKKVTVNDKGICEKCVNAAKTAGPMDVENPGATFDTGTIPNAKVNRAIKDLAAAMKDRSPHGALDILQDPTKHEEIEHAVRTMMQHGFQFTTQDIDWITWPVEPYEDALEGPPSDEARQQHEEFGKRIQATPGYRELNEILESFYQ